MASVLGSAIAQNLQARTKNPPQQTRRAAEDGEDCDSGSTRGLYRRDRPRRIQGLALVRIPVIASA